MGAPPTRAATRLATPTDNPSERLTFPHPCMQAAPGRAVAPRSYSPSRRFPYSFQSPDAPAANRIGRNVQPIFFRKERLVPEVGARNAGHIFTPPVAMRWRRGDRRFAGQWWFGRCPVGAGLDRGGCRRRRGGWRGRAGLGGGRRGGGRRCARAAVAGQDHQPVDDHRDQNRDQYTPPCQRPGFEIPG